MVIVTFKNFVVMQAKGNKKQILAMKYQVWISAFLQNFRVFWCFSLFKKLGRGLFTEHEVVNLGKGLIQASKTQSVDDENILLAMKTPSQIKGNLFFRFTPIFFP